MTRADIERAADQLRELYLLAHDLSQRYRQVSAESRRTATEATELLCQLNVIKDQITALQKDIKL